MNTITATLSELDPQAGAPTEITAQDEDLLRAIMATPVHEAVPARKQRSHVRRTLLVGGLVAATVALGLMRIDVGGHDVTGSPAAAVLERAADVTIKTSDPAVGPGQYLRITTTTRAWGSPILVNPDPDAPPPDHIDNGPPIGRDGKPIVFEDLRTQHMWVPHDRADTWVFDEESRNLRTVSVDAEKYVDGEKYHRWTSKGGASTNWHGYSKYQDADWYASLPRDPERLLNTLLKDARSYAANEHYEALNEAVTPVLTSGLAPADIRAALFRALANEPQVRIVDGVTHVDGKAAIALRMGYALEMLFDQDTGQYIGNQYRGTDFPTIPGVIGPDDPTSITTVRTDVVDAAPGQD
jgi:RNA polymerase sigma-70 factor (ECF subfamily)